MDSTSMVPKRIGEPNTNGLEWEMSRHQHGLVDTCLEEGQYESAIVVLEQLRSSNHKPSTSHIRQLLYIALYPSSAISEKGKEKSNFDPSSPSKTAKQQKSSLVPSPAATAAAQRLLMSFANTNSPESIFRALPCCGSSSSGEPELCDDEEDSLIAREALYIKESKHCWSLLVEGFVLRRRQIFSTPKGKGKNRRGQFEGDIIFNKTSATETRAVVAENAWPVLDWFLRIFERDELATEHGGLPRHSPLLLFQIPSPRSGTGARWETDAPLDIVFYSLRQTDQRRRMMGARLITLLINLSSTIHLDFPMFVTSVFTRLSAFTSDGFLALLWNLGSSPVISKFKVALCQRFIIDTAITDDPAQVIVRPKPQVRAQPRVVRIAEPTERRQNEPSTRSATSNLPPSVASGHPLPQSAEILRLVETNLRTPTRPSTDASLRIKFELLTSYGTLQAQAAVSDKDSEWTSLLRDGRLGKTLDIAFGHADGGSSRIYRESLESLLPMW